MNGRIDLFTAHEVSRARDILRTSMDTVQASRRIFEEVVTDEVMNRIDRETNQTNDRRYMAYRLEAIVTPGEGA